MIAVGRSKTVNYSDILMNLTGDGPLFKDFVDCEEGFDRIYVDTFDMYKNCDIVNEFNQGHLTSNHTVEIVAL